MPRAKSAPPEAGDVWTWTAICADTKLVPSWRVGDRSAATALDPFDDLVGRLKHRIQLTTDGHAAYLDAVDAAFGGDVDRSRSDGSHRRFLRASRKRANQTGPGASG